MIVHTSSLPHFVKMYDGIYVIVWVFYWAPHSTQLTLQIGTMKL